MTELLLEDKKLAADTVVDWLKAWSDPPWTCAHVDPTQDNPKFPATHFSDPTTLYEWVFKHHGTHNLYFMVNTPLPTVTTTPDIQRRNEIIKVNCLHVDIDLARNEEHTDENLRPLLRRLQAFSPQPTAIICSGGGFQAFWLFPEPLPAQDFIERTASVNEKIAESAKADHCWNVNRWMRLPGTMNLPNKAKLARGRVPMIAEVIEADWSRKWSFTDPIPSIPSDFYYDTESPSDHFYIGALPPKLQKAIKTGDAKDYGDDNSRLVLYIVTQLVRLAWPDNLILPFLIDPQYGSSAHCRSKANPEKTAQRQIDRAREKVVTGWELSAKGAIMRDSPKNIRKALDQLNVTFYLNTFNARTYANGYGPERLLDDDLEKLLSIKIYDECGFIPIDKALTATITDLAYKNIKHPVLEYLSQLTWDGTKRLDTWLIQTGEAQDNKYTRAVSRLMLVAAVRRVRNPGVKFDEMLVLINPNQGTDKSTALATLAVNDDWFSDSLPLNASDKEVIEAIAGRWIMEASDLNGIRKSDVDSLKAFLSRRVDRARMAYGHHSIDAPRQCVFFGTTNSETFLRDVSNRRFWPIRVGQFNIPLLTQIRDQLWAEAAHVEATKEAIRLDPKLWPLAAEHQDLARHEDPWASVIDEYLKPWEGRISTLNVWKILGKPIHQRTSLDSHHLTEVMVELGWKRSIQRIDGKPERCFIKGTKPLIVHVTRDISGELVISDETTKPTPKEDNEPPF